MTDNFEEYIQFLREHFDDLVGYREKTGTLGQELKLLRDDLFDEDPFVVFGASLLASYAFADKTLYH